MKTRVLLSIISAFFTITITAQEQNERQKPLEVFPLMNLSFTTYGDSEFIEDDFVGNVSFSEIKMALAFPKVLKNKKTVLINGIEFTNLKPTFSDDVDASSVSRNFYSIAYRFGIINPLGSKGWTYNFGLKPTLASDFKESMSSEDFIMQGSVLFSKRSSQNFKYGFGLSFNTRFGKQQIMPMVQIVYKKNNWGTNVYLPALVSQFYHFSTSKLGLSIQLNGNNYNFDNSFGSGLDLDKLSYSRINIGPEYEMELVKNLRLNLNGGIAVANKLDWLNGDSESELDLSPENKFFARVALKLVK